MECGLPSASHGENAETSLDASRASAHRFWDVPELVDHVLNYLSEDRVDLLVLSQVSKQLRAQALRIWARCLDIYLPDADKRVRFFTNNPTLLADVRYLRLRSDAGLRVPEPPCSSTVTEMDWTRLNYLLEMLAQRSGRDHALPLVDLTIRPDDPLRLPGCLSQRVVALRLVEHRNPRRSAITHPISSTPDHPYWNRVSEIIEQTAQGPGLHTFHIRADWSGSSDAVRVSEGMWQRLVQYAPKLRDLAIRVTELHILCPALATSHFDQLESFNLVGVGSIQTSTLEHILDCAENLRHLQINAGAYVGKPFRLQQTFPHLRWIEMGWRVDDDELRDFVRRHPNVIGNADDRLMPSLDATQSTSLSAADQAPIYPKLAFARNLKSATLQHHIDEGRPLAYLGLPYVPKGQDNTERCLRLLNSNPEAAQRVTCLQLSDAWNTMPSSTFELLGSRSLPNLAELHLESYNSSPHAEHEIGKLMAMLTSARYLKVIFLSGYSDLPNSELLGHDQEFPPALEYLCWQASFHPLLHFRFVSTHPEGGVIETAAGGKKGEVLNELHILINNNAGIAGPKTKFESEAKGAEENASAHLKSEEYEQWDALFRTNVASVFFTIMASLPLLEAGLRSPPRHGFTPAVVTLPRSRALSSNRRTTVIAYNCSKTAASHLTRMLSHELNYGHKTTVGIPVNAIAPGSFSSEVTSPTGSRKGGHSLPEDIQMKRSNGRGGTAEEIVCLKRARALS
ncbi:hypothetical protein OC861_000385 [Tilletia horrida]|nr:hypothetical protein OC845_003963 [Tilletia horrida]KAK0569935.1 hypothetical protein OC861_000385 [Tilletia horrida]